MADATAARAETGRWLDKATRDLAGARLCRDAPAPLLDLAAYHCQQAAEKTVKALLVLAGEPLMRTHDLDALCDKAATHFPALKDQLDAIRHLTPWGTVTRYPDLGGVSEPPVAEVDEALLAIDELLGTVRQLAAPPPSTS